jgi:transcription elongation GreA/GreB family factor
MSPKSALIEIVRHVLDERIATMESAAREAHAAASDPDSKAESKYDTRSLEASYLAAGQASQLAEWVAAAARIAAFTARDLQPGDPVEPGALVEVSTDDQSTSYLLAPAAGGLAVSFEDQEITLLAPASPLYQAILGKSVGDDCPAGIITEIR